MRAIINGTIMTITHGVIQDGMVLIEDGNVKEALGNYWLTQAERGREGEGSREKAFPPGIL